MEPEDRLRRLNQALAELAEASHDVPILVEGIRDEAALRALGVRGEVIVYNRGGSMLDMADRLRGRPRLILLFDWDKKGGQLVRLLRQQIEGQVQIDLETRRELAKVSLVRCVEDLPAARDHLVKRIGGEKRL